jgi:hypothetical protein
MTKFILVYWPVAVTIGILFAICMGGCHHEFKQTSDFQSQSKTLTDEETVKAKQEAIRKVMEGELFSSLKLDVDPTPATATTPFKPGWHAQLDKTQKTKTTEDRDIKTDTDAKKSTDAAKAVKAAGTEEGATDIGPGWKFYAAGIAVVALLLVFIGYAIKHKIWSPL